MYELNTKETEGVFSMILKHNAVAGSFESSDVYVTVEPLKEGVEIEIESSVISQYGKQIRASVENVLSLLEVEGAKVVVNDKGALDCTIRARVEAAILRACDINKGISWGRTIV